MYKFLLLMLAAGTVFAADVTGKWRGTLTPENRDPGPALVILEQKGETLTGTGGPDENERHDIRNGKVSGDKITFEIAAGEAVMTFELTQAGDELSGEIRRDREGQKQVAKLNLKREK